MAMVRRMRSESSRRSLKKIAITPVSDPGEQFHFFQIGKGLPQILRAVGFQGNEGVEIMVTQKQKKTGKIKITPSRRQMLVLLAMIVVQM